MTDRCEEQEAAVLARRYSRLLLLFAGLALVPFAFPPSPRAAEMWAIYHSLLGLASGWCGIAWIFRTARLFFAQRAATAAPR